MDDIIEFIIELFAGIGEEFVCNEEANKWIRHKWIRNLILTVLILFTTLVIGGIFILGISVIKENIIVGLMLISISLIFLICGIYKFKKVLKRMGNKNE